VLVVFLPGDYAAGWVLDQLVAERWTSSVELALRGTLLRGSGNAFGDPFGLCRVELSQDAVERSTSPDRTLIHRTGSGISRSYTAGRPGEPRCRIEEDSVELSGCRRAWHRLEPGPSLLAAARCGDVVVRVDLDNLEPVILRKVAAILLLAFDTQRSTFRVIADPCVDRCFEFLVSPSHVLV
jgi:hypothetical protein